MAELMAEISVVNSRRKVEAERYLASLKAVEAIKKNSGPYKVRPPLHRPAFVGQISPVGSEFHPVLHLKPKVLDAWTATRCVMPDRSFSHKSIPLRMQPTSEPFAPLSKAGLGKLFLEFLERHEQERMRHLYPILFMGEFKPPVPSIGNLDPFRCAVSSVSRDIQLTYPYQALGEQKQLRRAMKRSHE